jgi:hypothetical protein
VVFAELPAGDSLVTVDKGVPTAKTEIKNITAQSSRGTSLSLWGVDNIKGVLLLNIQLGTVVSLSTRAYVQSSRNTIPGANCQTAPISRAINTPPSPLVLTITSYVVQ